MEKFRNKTEEELHAIIASPQSPEDAVEAMCRLAGRKIIQDKPDAEHWLTKARELSQQANYRAGLVHVLSLQARAAHFKGDFSRAIALFQQAYEQGEAINNTELVAGAINGLANTYMGMTDYARALEYHQKGLRINEHIGDKEGTCISNLNVGNVYSHLADYKMALKYYLPALEVAEKDGYRNVLTDAMGNIGFSYSHLGEHEKAVNYLQKAIELNRQAEDVRGEANALRHLAFVEHNLKHFDASFECCDKALSLCQKINYVLGVADIYNFKGWLYLEGNKPGEALESLRQSLEIQNELNNRHLRSSTENLLSRAYKMQGLFETALEHHEKFYELEKEGINEDAHKTAAMFDVQRELEVKNKENEVTNRILLNILPAKIAERIKKGEEEIMERHGNATVMFADIVEFTGWSSNLSVQEVARHLNNVFQLFDELASQYGVEKIKTIGDAYMCVAGLPEPVEDHALRVANMALAMNEKIKEAYPNGDIKLRIGIHSGEVIAGVIGKNKYAYDLWGDTVNTASRMESHGLPDKIQVTGEFKNLVSDRFKFEDRGEIAMKGKGKVRTWFLLSAS